MAAESKHYLDIRLWIIKVIDSCINIEQCVTTFKLIRLYKKRLNIDYFEGKVYLKNIVSELEKKLEDRMSELKKIKDGKEVSN